MFEYLKRVINSASTESSKRFALIVALGLFELAFVLFLITLPFVIFRIIPASQQTINLFFAIFEKMLDHNVYIVYFGIGAVAAVTVTDMISSIFKRKAVADIISAQKGTPDTVVKNETVQNQNIDNGSVQQTPQPQKPTPNPGAE